MTVSSKNLTGIINNNNIARPTWGEKMKGLLNSESDPTYFAKKVGEAHGSLTTLKDKTALELAHRLNYLSPEDIHKIDNVTEMEKQIVDKGAVTIAIPEGEKQIVAKHLEAIKQVTEQYQEILEKEEVKIADALIALPAEERAEKAAKIFGAFMTEKNFNGLSVLEPTKRAAIAMIIGVKVLERFTNLQVEEHLKTLSDAHNFIQFNKSIEALAENISDVFKLSKEEALVLVLSYVKQNSPHYFKSLDDFYRLHQTHIEHLSSLDDLDMRDAIDAAEKNYDTAILALRGHYDKMINEAITKGAKESIRLLVKDIAALDREEQTLYNELHAINTKLKILATGGTHYYFRTIDQSKEELLDLKAVKETSYQEVLAQKDKKIQELSKIDHTHSLDFNSQEIRSMKKDIHNALEVLRARFEEERDLGARNIKEFKDLKALLNKVNVAHPVELQAPPVAKEARRLKAGNTHEWAVVRYIMSFMPKEPITILDVVRKEITKASGDKVLVREYIKALCNSLNPEQKKALIVEIGKALGETPRWMNNNCFKKGDAYLKAYFDELTHSQAIDFDLLQRVIESESGKKAVNLQPSSHPYLKGAAAAISVAAAGAWLL
ncbi:MAG: hypothetical protein FJZ63_02360 [Chlamydiae bacterium]|nr:hypothetical protein [Chlamydiota bacterium]